MSKFMIILIGACAIVIAVLSWEVNHPKTVTAPVVKQGKKDSTITVTPVPATVSDGYVVHVRDSAVKHVEDSMEREIEKIVSHGKVFDTAWDTEPVPVDTVTDTSYHFYGIGGKDIRGDSAFFEMGSRTFAAMQPSDMKYIRHFYPVPDSHVNYHRVDTVYKTVHSGWGWSITGGFNYGYRPDIGKADGQVGIQIGYGYQFSR